VRYFSVLNNKLTLDYARPRNVGDVFVALPVSETKVQSGHKAFHCQPRTRAPKLRRHCIEHAVDAARQMAKATYSLRDAISAYRSPLWSSYEFPNGDMDSLEGHVAMFQNRWRSVADALGTFDTAMLEAEALWGSTARESASPLKKCVHKLFGATEAFVDNKRVNGENFKADR
jgi:hypothetical protein